MRISFLSTYTYLPRKGHTEESQMMAFATSKWIWPCTKGLKFEERRAGYSKLRKERALISRTLKL
jgi:hypothetical protein